MNLQIYISDEQGINERKIDLFPSDTINLNQSIQSLRDLTKVFTDFTQSFKVPASDSNNATFKHYYQSQIDDGFDARTKRKARIEINGITFKLGKMQLNSVGIKSNKPEFYDIQFFGNTIDIKDLVGDDTLRDLDTLDALDFEYTDSNVRARLETNANVSFSLTSYAKRFLFNSDGNVNTPESVNIKYDPTYTNGIDWKDLKGYVKVSKIIDAIEQEYGFTFSRDFFGRAEFQQLYMSLGNGKSTRELLSENLLGEYNRVVFRGSGSNYIQNSYIINMPVSNQAVDYRLKIEVNGEVLFQTGIVRGNINIRFNQQNAPTGNYNVKYYIEAERAMNVTPRLRLESVNFPLGSSTLIDETVSITTLNPTFKVSESIANIKVLDWFSAILKSFNLVIVPQPNGTLYVNDLNSWYLQGAILDVSDYIDISTLQVSRGELFKEISFKYEDTPQILAAEYESTFGKQFGAEEISLLGLATDDTLEVKLPFENPQFERITNSLVQYAYIVDGELAPYDNKPFLAYLPTLLLDRSNRIGFNTDSSYIALNQANVPSHSITLSGGFTAQFADEFSEYNRTSLSDNFYSRFYKDYFDDLFSPKRRKYSFDAAFPPLLFSKIEINDRLIIKGERYVIDNIDTDLITGKTKLTLLNDLFETLIKTETSSTLSEKFGVFNDAGSFYYVGGEQIAIAFTDDDFITIDSQPPLVSFTLSENATLADRVGVIQIQDGLSDPTFVVLQPFNDFRKLAFDSNQITFDNTNITF